MRVMDFSSAARRRIAVRASNLTTLLDWVCSLQPADSVNAALREGAERQIDDACRLARARSPFLRMVTGADIQTATGYLDAAYVNILRLAPADYLDGLLTNLHIEAQQHLPPNDPRLDHLRGLQQRGTSDQEPPQFSERDRYVVVATLQATQEAAHREQGRVRNLRTVIIGVAAVTTVLVVGTLLLGVWRPGALPMCFAPTESLVVCPFSDRNVTVPEDGAIALELRRSASPEDTALVLGVGLLGAAISAAAGLRRMRASHDPYSLQVWLAVTKLPIGALTAFLGVLLLRAEFVPGLSALDSSAQIIGWAILLGYAQQLFTGFVDRQAATLLEQAASAPEPAKAPASTPARGPAAAPAIA